MKITAIFFFTFVLFGLSPVKAESQGEISATNKSQNNTSAEKGQKTKRFIVYFVVLFLDYFHLRKGYIMRF